MKNSKALLCPMQKVETHHYSLYTRELEKKPSIYDREERRYTKQRVAKTVNCLIFGGLPAKRLNLEKINSFVHFYWIYRVR